jgi:AsmA protein
MGKLIKWLFGLVLFLVVLVVAAVIILPMVVDPNDYKDEIVQVVKDRTGRDLEINKSLDLSVFPWLGIQTGGVSLSNRDGFGDKPFARIEQLGLRVKLMPLLSSRIEVDTLVLKGLDLNLVRQQDGQTNWDDLAAADEQKKEDKPAGEKDAEAPVEFKVAGVELADAAISWDDRQAGQRYVLRDVNLATGSLEPGVSVPVEGGFALSSMQPQLELVTDLQAEIQTNREFNQYTISDLRLNLKGEGEGLPEGGMAIDVEADIDMDLVKGLLKVAGLSVEGPEVSLKGDIEVADMNASPRINGALQLGETNVKKLVALFGTVIETTDEQALTAVSADLQMAHDGKALKIDPLTIKLDDSNIQGYLHVLDPEGPVLRSDIRIDSLNVDRYLPPPAEDEDAQAKASAETSAAGEDPFGALRKLDLEAEARIGALVANKLNMQDVRVKVVSKDGVLKANPIGAKLYQGEFDGETTLDVRGKQPKLHARNDLTGIEIGPLLNDLAGQDRLLGTGSVNFDVRTVGLSEAEIRRSLNGNARFDFRNGAYKGVNLAALVRQAGGLLGRDVGGGSVTGAEAQTDFSEMSGSATISNGLITNRDLQAKSPLLRLDGRGQVNLQQETIDYTVTTELVPSLEGQGGKEAEKLTGVPIPVRIKGPLTDPSYSPDLSEAAKAKVQEKVQEEIEKKVGDKAGDILGDKLKGLFGN